MSGTDISAKIDEYAKTHIDELRSQESVKRKDMTKYDIASQMLANGMLTQAEFDSWAYGTKEGQDSYNSKFDSPSAFGSGFAFGSFDSFNTYDNGTYLDDISLALEQEKQASSVSSFFAAPKPEQNQPLPPHLAAQQKSQQTRTYAADKLYRQAGNAQDNLTDYYNSIGTISFDAVQQGLESIGNYTWDLLTGRNDFVTVYENAEALNNEIGGVIRLKNTTSPEEFNAKFKELYGIDYNEQAFLNLQQADTNLQTLYAYQNLSDSISDTLSNIDSADASNVRQAAFLHILPHVGNNKELAQQYVSQLNNIAQNDDQKFVQELKNFLSNAKTEYDNQLKSLNKNTLEQEYKDAYKQAMGGYNSEEIINQYISNMKTSAFVIEMGTTIAAAFFTAGSSTMLNFGSKVTSFARSANLGARATSIVTNTSVKGVATAATASFTPAVTIVSDATSNKGITAQTGEEAWEELKNGMMYGSFGAFVSGPIGDGVAKILSKNPQIFKSIIPQIIGTVTETTADVIFDRLTSDMTVKESLSQNGIMNFGMMFAGSAINRRVNQLRSIKVEKNDDGSYTLIRNGETIGTANNDNELAMSVLILGTEGQKAQGVPDNLTLHPEVPEDHQANIFTQKPQEHHIVQLEEAPQAPIRGAAQEDVDVFYSAADEMKLKNAKEDFAKLLEKDGFSKDYINNILSFTTKENFDLVNKLHTTLGLRDCGYENFKIILSRAKNSKEYQDFVNHILDDSSFVREHKKEVGKILAATTDDNIELSNWFYENYERLGDVIRYSVPKMLTEIAKKDHAKYFTTQFSKATDKQLSSADHFQALFVEVNKKLLTTEFQNATGCSYDEIPQYCLNLDNISLACDLYNDKEFPNDFIEVVLGKVNRTTDMEFAGQLPDLVKKMYNDPDFPNECIHAVLNKVNSATDMEFACQLRDLAKDLSNAPKQFGLAILRNTNKDNISVVRTLCGNQDYSGNLSYDMLTLQSISARTRSDKAYLEFAKEICNIQDIQRTHKNQILYSVNEVNMDFARELFNDPKFPKDKIGTMLACCVKKDDIDFAKELIKSDFSTEYIGHVVYYKNKNNIDIDEARELCRMSTQGEISASLIPIILENKIPKENIQKMLQVMGKDNVNSLSDADFAIAADFIDLYGKKSINEISMSGKSELIRKLVSSNTGMFGISDKMKKNFPLIPTKTEEYCSLLSSIVKSLGVDIRTIEPPSRIKEFNNNVSELSSSLARIPDSEFANLQISLDYTKDDFVSDVLARVKDLSPNEQQKVYDYFGFELQKNENNKTTGYAIIGYPINLNNGKKLAEITDPRTKAVVEELRPDVVRFSEQNPIKCNNPQVEKLLNEIIDVVPEMRTEIGKKQHGTHDYDVFQHSLKVMQKIAQNPKFQTLNESDQKIMMLASMLHDITKGEGVSDPTHAKQGSFDAFYISKKFNLTREEETKLYTLIRHHEWLGSVNSAKSEDVLTKRLQSVAFDLQNDNLFDMALMFTHADLQAVKKDNTFHDTTQGETRARFDGETRVFDKSQGSPVSHGQAADIYAQRIRGYIEELKTSQPLLPVTKFPKADRINSAITVVNPDGSTNIKGVYKRPDGLIVIKYNEVEDWEKIGFPKGTVSRGYTSVGKSNKHNEQYTDEVNTGNIKFFVHGLDYENQLTKFDAFSLLDSDALLSLSYAERVESKYHFFRPQGVLLDFDTKYIYGGGETDAGSGCGKSLEIFKKDYVFGGVRQGDRVFVSNLIKEATGMNDAEYVKFVEANRNKSFTEIEPAEYREPIIKVFASINSRIRKGGDRAYNEMYGSNPREVMGVFAYSKGAKDNEGAVGNPIQFLEQNSVTSRTEFLQRYALEHNIPFVIFGD